MKVSFLCLLLMLVVIGCEEKIKPSVTEVPSKDIPSHESWNSTITFSDSAMIKAVLWAGHISRYSALLYTILEDSLRVDFYNEHEEHTSVLTSLRGRVDDRTEDFAAYGNVVVTSDSGVVLKTDSLFWDNSRRKIHTPAFVEIISPKEHIMGQGLEGDQGLKNYTVFRVTGRAVTDQ